MKKKYLCYFVGWIFNFNRNIFFYGLIFMVFILWIIKRLDLRNGLLNRSVKSFDTIMDYLFLNYI